MQDARRVHVLQATQKLVDEVFVVLLREANEWLLWVILHQLRRSQICVRSIGQFLDSLR